MLIPLKQWVCDACKEIIEKHEEGNVIWEEDYQGLCINFKITHNIRCNKNPHSKTIDIESLIGVNGISKLLAFLTPGPIRRSLGSTGQNEISDFDNFVDLFRRLQVPHYEEARIKFSNFMLLDEFSDANEYSPYQSEILKQIIETWYEE